MFKVGDRVRFIGKQSGDSIPNWATHITSRYIKHGSVTLGKNYDIDLAKVVGLLNDYIFVEYEDKDFNKVCLAFESNCLELIESSDSKGVIMSLKEKFALAFKSEPEKSFRQAGITNGDDLLTDEGQSIFLSWLLKKNGDDFKKEVVDLLEEKK